MSVKKRRKHRLGSESPYLKASFGDRRGFILDGLGGRGWTGGGLRGEVGHAHDSRRLVLLAVVLAPAVVLASSQVFLVAVAEHIVQPEVICHEEKRQLMVL